MRFMKYYLAYGLIIASLIIYEYGICNTFFSFNKDCNLTDEDINELNKEEYIILIMGKTFISIGFLTLLTVFSPIAIIIYIMNETLKCYYDYNLVNEFIKI